MQNVITKTFSLFRQILQAHFKLQNKKLAYFYLKHANQTSDILFTPRLIFFLLALDML